VSKYPNIEEAGCQAHEQFSLGERIVGIDFLKVLNCSYSALRLPVCPVVEAWKGSGAAKGLLSREGAHFLGGTCMWGMMDCRLLV
jgi:hypothetical protein